MAVAIQELTPRGRWKEGLASSTWIAGERILGKFEEFCGTSAESLLTKALRGMSEGKQPQFLEDVLRQFHNHLVAERMADSSAFTYFNCVRGFYSANNITLRGLPKNQQVKGANYEPMRVLKPSEVRGMVESRKHIEDKAIIAFLAQTGQREGLVPGVRHDILKIVDGHGIADVPAKLENPQGKIVNKCRVRYQFIIGKDTMNLLNELPENGAFIFTADWRKVIRVIEQAAEDTGIQEIIRTKLGRKHHAIHPHTMRSYFQGQADAGGLEEIQREYIMGHRVKYDGTYARAKLTPEALLKSYKHAEPKLAIFPK